MLSDNNPLTSDSGALQNALEDLGFVDFSCLTNNPLLYLWLQAAHQDPDTFVQIEESFFSLNKSETLQEYRLGVRISTILMLYIRTNTQIPRQ